MMFRLDGTFRLNKNRVEGEIMVWDQPGDIVT